MPNYPLGFSVIEEFQKENSKPKNSIDKKKTRKNRETLSQKRNTKVEEFFNSLEDGEDEQQYESFQPNARQENNVSGYSRPISAYNEKMKDNEQKDTNTQNTNDEYVGKEEFNNIQSNTNQDYYSSYIPYSDNVSAPQNISGEKDMFIEKLNYMIHLLEEQQEEKTGHVTEELILYSFLGVFVIFVIDSFARAGKYVR